jgi:hypothetical protein
MAAQTALPDSKTTSASRVRGRYRWAALALWTLSLGTGCNPTPPAVASSAYEEDATPESLPSFALRWLFGVGMGKRVREGRLQLYYDTPVTESQARATARFLRRFGLGDRDALVQIRRAQTSASAPSSYEIRLGTPYTRREHIDRETRAAFQLLALSAEGAVFDGEPVHLYVCNSMLQPLVILRPRLKPLSP